MLERPAEQTEAPEPESEPEPAPDPLARARLPRRGARASLAGRAPPSCHLSRRTTAARGSPVASDLVMVKKPMRDRASSAFLTRKLNEPTSSSYVTGFL